MAVRPGGPGRRVLRDWPHEIWFGWCDGHHHILTVTRDCIAQERVAPSLMVNESGTISSIERKIMSRLPLIDPANAPAPAGELLAAVKSSLV